MEEAVGKVVGDEEVDKVLWGFMFNVFERDVVDDLIPEGWYNKIQLNSTQSVKEANYEN